MAASLTSQFATEVSEVSVDTLQREPLNSPPNSGELLEVLLSGL